MRLRGRGGPVGWAAVSSCWGLFCGRWWCGLGMVRCGAVRLLADSPWSSSHCRARSPLLRICWPQQLNRGPVGGEW